MCENSKYFPENMHEVISPHLLYLHFHIPKT